ncbi:serine--tRNA ligase [bacterium]|nr:serine--tRNA ligase [bacterium]
MHDIKRLRQEPGALKASLGRKGFDADIEKALDLDRRRREAVSEADGLKAELNKASRAIGEAKKAGRDAAEEMEAARKIRERSAELDEERRTVEEELHNLLLTWPAEPDPNAPDGRDETENVVVHETVMPDAVEFERKDHLTLAESLGILDMPRGAKIAGSGFPLYLGLGARLERALINFMLDMQINEHGYTEVLPPFMVNSSSALGTGQLPKFPEDMYYVERDDFYLIPTAEVPVTNMHRDEILNAVDLPIRYAAYTACFRREAGAHGQDTRGLLRMHQFNKVELVQVTTEEASEAAHEEILEHATSVLDTLNITYRIVELCTGDLTFGAARCYDIEVWAPGTGAWLEASSVSNFRDFQARRMNLRYRPEGGGKPLFAHTLNGSGLATSRLMVALLETYQTPEARVIVPRPLQPYMSGVDQIRGRDR